MTYQNFPSKAGVDKDNSPLGTEFSWVDADKVRFVGGLPETIYGWERASTDVLLGICRGLVTWADNDRNPLAAMRGAGGSGGDGLLASGHGHSTTSSAGQPGGFVVFIQPF